MSSIFNYLPGNTNSRASLRPRVFRLGRKFLYFLSLILASNYPDSLHRSFQTANRFFRAISSALSPSDFPTLQQVHLVCSDDAACVGAIREAWTQNQWDVQPASQRILEHQTSFYSHNIAG